MLLDCNSGIKIATHENYSHPVGHHSIGDTLARRGCVSVDFNLFLARINWDHYKSYAISKIVRFSYVIKINGLVFDTKKAKIHKSKK